MSEAYVTQLEDEIPQRVIFSGSHCTGKTTLYNWLKSESSRTYYYVKEHPITFAVFRPEPIRFIQRLGFGINKEADDTSQLAMAAYHMQTLMYPEFVSDRCIVDLLVYAEYLHDIDKTLVTEKTVNFVRELADDFIDTFEGVVFFCRPIPDEKIKADGVRDTDDIFRNEIDSRMFDFWSDAAARIIKRASVFSISEPNFLDRTKLVKDALSLRVD